jgi:glyoxylase-like metal-dependent hydrolase (beta-lactamase superfamily II)
MASMIPVNIYTVSLGFTQCYLLRGERSILIDCGPPNKERLFLKRLKRFSVRPGEIKLIIATHGHWDHIGSAKAIKEITGAGIAIHEKEKDCLQESLMMLPPSAGLWAAILARTMSFLLPSAPLQATPADLLLGNQAFPLGEYGIPGKVMNTPGHSQGSVSVLLESGEAFVGDLAMNRLPLRLCPGLPIFAEDLKRARESLRMLLDQGAKTVYPAHGRPFPGLAIRKMLA